MPSDFHEVRFPLDVALGSRGGPVRKTEIVTLASGREHRNECRMNGRFFHGDCSFRKSSGDLVGDQNHFAGIVVTVSRITPPPMTLPLVDVDVLPAPPWMRAMQSA